MTYNVEITPKVERIIQELNQPIQERLVQRIEALAKTPFPPEAEKIGRPKGNIYLIPEGDYCIVYRIKDDVFLIADIQTFAPVEPTAEEDPDPQPRSSQAPKEKDSPMADPPPLILCLQCDSSQRRLDA